MVMRQLGETQLFNLGLEQTERNEIQNAINMKLNQGTGIIAPKHIEPELLKAKLKAKKMMGLLNDGISLYEDFNGRIKMFNLGLTSSARTPIPGYMPFVLAKARNRQLEGDTNPLAVSSPTIYMNMYRIGNWSADEKLYENLNATTDLAAILESGAIMYSLLYGGKSDKLFSNSVILENLTRIYTSMFSNTVIRTETIYGDDFNTDAARFFIAKFFLRYVLKKPQTETIDTYAYQSVRQRGTALASLKIFEQDSDIDYTSLTSFLETLGNTFFSKPIDFLNFQIKWASMYGQGLSLAIEYVPYFLHYLIALGHGSGATLGGSTRLAKSSIFSDIRNDGLIKLLNTVTAILR